eukprot:scaffold122176_cov13-Tisochrysis_lutea.AAC.1
MAKGAGRDAAADGSSDVAALEWACSLREVAKAAAAAAAAAAVVAWEGNKEKTGNCGREGWPE